MESTKKINWLEAMYYVFRRRLWFVLLAAVIGGTGLFAYKAVTYKPAYTSTATVYVLNNSWVGEGSLEDVSSTLNVSINAVGDCKSILERPVVLDKVSEVVGTRVTKKMIKVSLAGEDTGKSRMIDIQVTARSPQLAHDIAKAICECGKEVVSSIMKADMLNLVDEASMPQGPNSSRFSLPWFFIGAVCGAAALFLLFLCLHVFSEKIRTSEDVEQYLNMRVLGVIPSRDDSGKEGRYGYFSRLAGKYGKKYYRSGMYGDKNA